MKIVIIEDEIRVRNGLKKIIHKINPSYEIIGEASDGEEGYAITKSLKPDVVFTDIKMPGGDGLSMLECFSSIKDKPIIVVLSGHPSFDYARRAIAFGVTDYLLKPITVEDIVDVLDRVKAKIAKKTIDENQIKAKVQSPEEALEALLRSQHQNMDSLLSHLNGYYNINDDQKYLLIIIYINVEQAIDLNRRIEDITCRLKGAFTAITVLKMHERKQLIGLMPMDVSCHHLETVLENGVLNHLRSQGNIDLVIGCTKMQGISRIQFCVNELTRHLRFAIVLGSDRVILSRKVVEYKAQCIEYPQNIEREAVRSIYAHDFKKLLHEKKNFIDYWCGCYAHPDQVTEAYIRFTTSIINSYKDVNVEVYNKSLPAITIVNLMEAFTQNALDAELIKVVGCFITENKYNNKEHGMLVVKTLQYIEKNYMHEISLGMIARNLEVTPEYLSMLFAKEVNENYMAYLKRLRVEKAKYLLQHSDFKIEEISLAVGYSNTKYFYRVFKEIADTTPRRYMVMQREEEKL